MIYDQPNLSSKDLYRIHGTLPASRIELLMDNEERFEQVSSAAAYVQEGMGQFPAEDFLSDIESRLQAIAKRLRGDNKEQLLAVIESLSDLAQTTFYASDYGRSELHKALKAMEG